MKKVVIIVLGICILFICDIQTNAEQNLVEQISNKLEKNIEKKNEYGYRMKIISKLNSIKNGLSNNSSKNNLISGVIDKLYENNKVFELKNYICKIENVDIINNNSKYLTNKNNKLIGINIDCTNISNQNIKADSISFIAKDYNNQDGSIILINKNNSYFSSEKNIESKVTLNRYIEPGQKLNGWFIAEISDDINELMIFISESNNVELINGFLLSKIKNKREALGEGCNELNINIDGICIDKSKILSSNERPIGTIEITDGDMLCIEGNDIWEIITTNEIVKGYHSCKNLRTNEINSSYGTQIQLGTYLSGNISLSYYYWHYPNLKIDLVTNEIQIKIIGETVFSLGGKEIGKFYPNYLTAQSIEDIPLTQGCNNFWSDNYLGKFYYDKNSIFSYQKTNSYNYNFIYFCSEQDAIKAGYKKSKN